MLENMATPNPVPPTRSTSRSHDIADKYWDIDHELPRGYCLIINNQPQSAEDTAEPNGSSYCVDVLQLEELLRTNFSFLVATWPHMNHSTLEAIFKCLAKVKLQCLMVIFLGTSRSVRNRRLLSLKQVQDAVSVSLDCPRPTLLLCHVQGLEVSLDEEVNQQMFSNDCKEYLHQLIFKKCCRSLDDKQVDQICVLSKFFKGEEHLDVEKIASKNGEFLHYIKPQQQRKISIPNPSCFAEVQQVSKEPYSPGVKYKEFDMACMIWNEIRTNTIKSIEDQKQKIKEFSQTNQKERLSCAVSSLVTGLFTIGIFIALLLIQDTGIWPQIVLVIFGIVMQLVNIFGNVYSVYCVRKEYKMFKTKIAIAKELAEIDLIHWKIVEEAKFEFLESSENTDPEIPNILQHIGLQALETFKTIYNISSIVIYSTRIASTAAALVWRTISIALRVIVILALVGSLICIPLDIVEIVMLTQYMSKPSKLEEKFEMIIEELSASQTNVLKTLKETKEKLYNDAIEHRKKAAGNRSSLTELSKEPEEESFGVPSPIPSEGMPSRSVCVS